MNTDPKFAIAFGILEWYLRRAGFRAITLPPWGIYMLPESLDDLGLREHEMVHWRQAQRWGVLRFYCLYMWYQIRHGYEHNPFEIEAREISGRR
jgi:hypothetical protein